ncbi:hypothetical protein BGZ95_011933 [Linnemannia exigua]|uniref:Uncharacterized protein n=1 Tax=Linnemannia exigua TaxID=604196 RepID=A0AAD4H634_9FUNG|nr:hypothetical protein BGZ95_011933 [Linnemannia exigua]
MSDLESEAHEGRSNTGGTDNVDELAAELFPEDQVLGANEEASSSAGPSTEPNKKKRVRVKKIKLEDEDDAEYGRRKKSTATTKATKRTARSTSTSSAKKRATRPLIEIFEQPDADVESVDAVEEQEATTANAQGVESDKHRTEADQQDVFAGSSTVPVPMEIASLPEHISTENTTDQPSAEDVEDIGNAQGHVQAHTQVHAQEIHPSTPPPAYNSPPPAIPSLPPVTHSPLRSPSQGQGTDSAFRRIHNTTFVPTSPVRRQAVTFEDIEDANVVIVDPSTPVRRAASRMDIEGWEDEDRRDSNQSELTSPFISPSQWHLDASLMTSTPNAKRTSAQPFRGITPRQKRIKDVIGMANLKSPLRSSHVDRLGRSLQLASPSPKKAARSAQIPPEMKQSLLIDRLDSLMQENAGSEVMAVAGQALQEGARELRRSQNKERRQAVAEAEAAEAAAEATTASILKHKEIVGRTEADAFFGDDGGLQEFSEGDTEGEDETDINFMRTPVKKTARVLFESTTPTTPIKTPSASNMSLVISALGAASRRNNSATAMSPFVRTPVKKTKDLRLEDLHVDPDPPPQILSFEPLPQPQPQPVPSAAETLVVKPGANQTKTTVSNAAATTTQSTWADVSMTRVATGSELGGKAVPSLRKDLSHQQQQPQPEQPQQPQRGAGASVSDTKGRRLHPDPEEHRRRTRLLEEANFSESQLQMTVEEFHRTVVEEYVLSLEVNAEAWIQQFEEQSNRVRRALLGEERM